MRRSAAQGWRDLRGCAFEHTAACESYFAQRLHDAMETHGVRGCNLPLGHFEYSTSAAAAPASSSAAALSSLSSSSSSLSAADTTPAAEASSSSSSSSSEAADSAPTACCIVMRTLGDRRLGSHVLAGVALLLDRLVSFRSGDDDGRSENAQAASASANLDDHELAALFPSARPRDAAELGGVVTAEQLMSDHQMAQGMQYFADADDDATATGLAFAQPRTAALFANALRLDFSRAAAANSSAHARSAPANTAADSLGPLTADSAAAMGASRVAITAMREVAPDASQLPDQCTADAGFVACDPRWAHAWAQTCETLRQRLDRLAQRRNSGGNRHACFGCLIFVSLCFDCSLYSESVKNVFFVSRLFPSSTNCIIIIFIMSHTI